MIFRHYLELVRAAEAKERFGITPAAVEAAKVARQAGMAGKIVALASVAA